MTRFTKCLFAAVVAGFGFASQSASAAPPSVSIHPTVRPYHGHGHLYPRPVPYTVPYTMPYTAPYSVQYPSIYPIAPRHDHDYIVLYRPSVFSGWQKYGKFETRGGAEAAERRLEWQGIPTRIVRVHDYYNGGYGW